MFNRGIAAALATSIGSVGIIAGFSNALAGKAEAHAGRIFGHENIRRHILRTRRPYRPDHFDPRINRWTGKPHEHRMERARRLTKPGTKPRHTAEMAARAGFQP